VIQKVPILFLSLALSACSTTKPGEYGLLAIKEPHYASDGTAKVEIHRGISLTGSSCYRVALMFFPATLHQNRDAAILDAIEDLNRPEVIGLADVKVYERTRVFWPFYFDSCYVVEGYVAESR